MITISTADKLNVDHVFIPDEVKDGIPYEESVDWVEQFVPDIRARMIATNRRIILIVGSRNVVESIWTMKNNKYNGVCHLEWEDNWEDDDD